MCANNPPVQHTAAVVHVEAEHRVRHGPLGRLRVAAGRLQHQVARPVLVQIGLLLLRLPAQRARLIEGADVRLGQLERPLERARVHLGLPLAVRVERCGAGGGGGGGGRVVVRGGRSRSRQRSVGVEFGAERLEDVGGFGGALDGAMVQGGAGGLRAAGGHDVGGGGAGHLRGEAVELKNAMKLRNSGDIANRGSKLRTRTVLILAARAILL